MGVNSWGASPLYETGNCLEDSIPNVTRQSKVLDEGNCGEVTNRGEEACEDVRKGPWVMSSSRAVHAALTTDYLTGQGLVSLLTIWQKLTARNRNA
jgi:hypothetical protein